MKIQVPEIPYSCLKLRNDNLYKEVDNLTETQAKYILHCLFSLNAQFFQPQLMAMTFETFPRCKVIADGHIMLAQLVYNGLDNDEEMQKAAKEAISCMIDKRKELPTFPEYRTKSTNTEGEDDTDFDFTIDN